MLKLDFVPIQNKINEPKLRSDSEEFYCRRRTKWHFRNEPTPEFSETPVFLPRSIWKPSMGHPYVEVFLSHKEHEMFQEAQRPLGYSSLPKQKWKEVRSLGNDRSIVIKKADKESCVVTWDRSDYTVK